MLKNENMICISSIDWDFVWQTHQEIMSTFARNGNRVLFIENTGIRTPGPADAGRLKKRVLNWMRSTKGFREVEKNLVIYSPMVLPFPYSKIAGWFNKFFLVRPLKRWIKTAEFYDPIVWTFLPTGIALDIVNSINKKLLVYYCLADFYQLVDRPAKVKLTEDRLIKQCDVIFAQGVALKDKCAALNKNVHVFTLGVSANFFKDLHGGRDNRPEDIKDIKRPIIGYVGGIHKHVDLGLIQFIATSRPEWTLVLVGPAQINISELAKLSNVILLGQKAPSSMPDYINEFDVAIIPYRLNDYTATVFPHKLNEYHAMGRPVVSMALPEVVAFNKENDGIISIGRTYEEFLGHITNALQIKRTEEVQKRIGAAKKNMWSSKIEGMSGFLEAAIQKKADHPMEWKKKFLNLYRISRNKIFTFAGVVLIGFFMIFYTNLVWWIAEPLKISQEPSKADCIVVFAGGVGESGKPGQGYEERVQKAVELYREGYADKIIFSSGYTYFFKEPQVMKALAVSLGIPENSIILEDRAGDTFQNIKFTKDILDRKKWKSVLLVSSPYHMKRAFLTFRKAAADIKVTYVPITNGHFYMHKFANPTIFQSRINIEQIRGILHEYLGIVYYWFKGYI